jgi:hypothetical protein
MTAGVRLAGPWATCACLSSLKYWVWVEVILFLQKLWLYGVLCREQSKTYASDGFYLKEL